MILKANDHNELYDRPYTLTCPHCNAITGITLLSVPNFAYLARFKPRKIGMVYMCNSCQEPIFLKFLVDRYEIGNSRIHINENVTQIEYPNIDFEFKYIPEPIKSDFKEALSCYSIGAYNGFASMCRRTIQSSANDLGAKGKSKVQKQIMEMKELADVDDDTYDLIKQIILDGHDGAHPHLPSLSNDRAGILLELVKDVMYQLYVRMGKLKEAAKLRSKQIKKEN